MPVCCGGFSARKEGGCGISRSKRVAAVIYEWMDALAFALVVVIVVSVFVFKSYMVRGISMEPTLHDGFRVFVVGLFYQPRQGDVVVTDEKLSVGDSIVKRVVATENQTVDMDPATGEMTVDGEAFSLPGEVFLYNLAGDMEFPAVVPEGCVFLMGDNRGRSHDSRYSDIGFVDRRSIIGRAVYVFMPFAEAGAVR